MPHSPVALENLKKSVLRRKMAKMERIANDKRIYKSEIYMNEAEAEAYLDSMAQNVADEPKVMNCMLKWLELKKKYANDTEDISLAKLADDD